MSENFFLYGTDEKPLQKVLYKNHDLQFYYFNGELDEIQYDSVEILRKISFLIRDENWGSWSKNITENSVENSINLLEINTKGYFELDKKNRCIFKTNIKVENGTKISILTTITPTCDIWTNRAGFVLLHPLKGVCGTEVNITSDGKTSKEKFPYFISPTQPFYNIEKIEQNIDDIKLTIKLNADMPFECEDQRNWSDASFKTYYRPLSEPYPYKLSKNISLTQSIKIDIASSSSEKKNLKKSMQNLTKSTIPTLFEHCNLHDYEQNSVDITDKKIIRIDTTESTWHEDLKGIMQFLIKDELLMEIILPDDEQQSDIILKKLSAVISQNTYIVPLPKAYLKSYQPLDDFPLALTPSQSLVLANRYFDKKYLGCGVLTYFPEFNRHGVASHLAGFIYHSNTATIHDTSDKAVMQTLESMPYIYETALVKTGSYMPYKLGLSTIALQSNPYGNSIGGNELRIRETMSGFDPRHNALFGASWVVGFVASLLNYDIDSFCFSSSKGSFSSSKNGQLYPIFHILQLLNGASGKSAVSLNYIENTAIVCWRDKKIVYGLISNLTCKKLEIKQSNLKLTDMKISLLDKNSTIDASGDMVFFQKLEKSEKFNLSEYAICHFQGVLDE